MQQTPVPPNYEAHRAPMPIVQARPPVQPAPAPAPAAPIATGATGRPREVFTLGDEKDAAIPEDVKKLYRQDDQGHTLFWTVPPTVRSNGGLSEASTGLGHSVRYLADLDEWRKEREAKRKARDERMVEEAKRRRSEEGPSADAARSKALDETAEYLASFFRQHAADTKKFREESNLDKWDALMAEVHGKN